MHLKNIFPLAYPPPPQTAPPPPPLWPLVQLLLAPSLKNTTETLMSANSDATPQVGDKKKKVKVLPSTGAKETVVARKMANDTIRRFLL